jgi:SAM-dependent methyltransferase
MSIGMLTLRCTTLEQKFTDIYKRGAWSKNEQGEGISGWGSQPDVCQGYIRFIEHFMREKNIRTVVDAGCGDWLFSRFVDWSNVTYIGFEVVESLVARNNALFANDHISFVHADFLTIDLPPADLLLCKDVLQHLCHEDIVRFLPQLKKYKYCLITNDLPVNSLPQPNPDTPTGEYRKLDLSQPPFNLPGVAVLNYRVWNEIHQVFLIENTDL